ncbi:M67 family metallopeptidase [Marine Group I thaumarchaeote]|uniref:M67 family metallopeptidase n=1 Tax=Marine Group I thaumarchaeote TaxID=2511932 RepID=A0A7K4N208_9ARCH|nr:M67 family metallopeptidase [Marine Group I thaumarchaeote]
MECLVLTQKEKDKLVAHAREQQPSESCAMLLGKKVGDNWNVKEVFLTQNIDNSQTNFTISPEELLKGYQLAEKMQLELVGVFHSHPNSDAIPSSTDKKFMQNNPVPWIIFSGVNNNLKAYLLDSNIIEIPIKID